MKGSRVATYTVSLEQMIFLDHIDKYIIPQILIENGFVHVGGPLMPRLLGIITREYDPVTNVVKFTQCL